MLKHLVALVTGGASGLGKATVQKLANEGCKVVLCDLKTSLGDKVAGEIGNGTIFSPTDVRDEKQVADMMDSIRDKFKKLDVVVNCAGIACAFQVYNFNKNHMHLMDDFKAVFETKTAGSFNVIRNAVPLMAAKEPDENDQCGVIINVSGMSAFDGQKGQTAVAAADGALNSMTLPLCRDLSVKGIRVLTIAPGLFDTPLLVSWPEKVVSHISKVTPSPQRLGKPEEFADLVTSLIKNPMINGEVIRIDGALRMYLI